MVNKHVLAARNDVLLCLVTVDEKQKMVTNEILFHCTAVLFGTLNFKNVLFLRMLEIKVFLEVVERDLKITFV